MNLLDKSVDSLLGMVDNARSPEVRTYLDRTHFDALMDAAVTGIKKAAEATR